MIDPKELISESLKEERLKVCAGSGDIPACPAYRISKLDPTLGAGEFFGLNTKIEQPTCGEFGRPMTGISCGCLLNLKAPIKLFNCPQKKWKK
jgi:hypothetical protein